MNTARTAVAHPRLVLLADGVVGGGLTGLITLAAVAWAPGELAAIAAFLTAPAVLATCLLHLPGGPAAAGAIVGGSMLLYGAYAWIVSRAASTNAAVGWIVAILLLHAACLITWAGLALTGMISNLPV